jgi:hypothetical protein
VAVRGLLVGAQDEVFPVGLGEVIDATSGRAGERPTCRRLDDKSNVRAGLTAQSGDAGDRYPVWA